MAAQTYTGITDSSGNANIYRKTASIETALILGKTGYGVDFKAWGALAGEYMQWDSSATQFGILAAPTTWNGTSMQIYTTPACTTAGVRNGAVNITTYRSVAWVSNDGNPDCALKIQCYNYSVSGTYSGVRGLDINARNRTGSCGFVNGGMITAENYNDSGNVTTLTGFEVHAKNNSVVTGNVTALRVMDESGSSTGTHYGMELTTGDGAFMRAAGLQIDCDAASGAGWTNAISLNGAITNVLDFENSNGTNGATLKEGTYSGSGNTIKIQCDCEGVAYYLIAHATVS